MLYLAISILLMSALAVILRWSVGRGADPHGLNAVYRITGGVVTLLLALPTLDWSRLPELWHAAGIAACVAAVFYWLTGLASIKCVELGPLGASWTVIRCSMVIPALASLLYWREVPLWPPSPALGCRLSGLLAVAGALVLLGGKGGRAALARDAAGIAAGASRRAPAAGIAWAAWLALAFVAQGAWEVCLRSTRSYADGASRSFFLVVTFCVAMLLAGGGAAATRVRIRWKDIRFGVLAGTCALAASGVRVWALRDVDGIIVFPATTAGVLLLVQGAGCLFWGERVSRRGVTALALAIAGIALLTVRVGGP